MAALFCYKLCRDLDRSRAASVLAGVVYGLGGWMGTTEWPQMLNGAVWAPPVLMFFLRMLRGHKPVLNSALSGACLGLAFLSGHHQIPIYLTLLMAALWIRVLVVRDLRLDQAAKLAALFGVLLILVGAAQLLPAREYGQLALRWVGAQNPVGWNDPVPYPVHNMYSLGPVSILGIVVPGIHLNVNPFIGLTAITLAIIGVFLAWSSAYVRLFTYIGIGALLFSLGGASVFHGIIYSLVPWVEKARSPAMAILGFHLAVAVLASFGVDELVGAQQLPATLSRLITWGPLAFGITLYVMLGATFFSQGEKVYYQIRPAAVAFTAVLLSIVMAGWIHRKLGRAGVTSCFVLLVMLELSNVTTYSYTSREQGWNLVDPMYRNTDIVRFLKQQQQPIRVGIDRTAVPFNFGDWFGIEEFEGFCGLTAKIYAANWMKDTHLLMGEQFWVASKPQRPEQQLVFQGTSGLNVYQNPDAFSRVWPVHRALAVKNQSEIISRLNGPLGELKDEVLLTGQAAPDLETCPGADDIRLESYGQSSITIQAKMNCRGMVILGDTFFPGWRATVDGAPVPVYEVFSLVRGVVVPSGNHQIKFRYRPISVLAGAALSLLGACIIGFLWWRASLVTGS